MLTTRTTKRIDALAALLALLPALVQAQEIGHVLITRGHVEARAADGSVRALARRVDLLAGDTVVTGAGGFVQMKLADDARLALGSGTEFTFGEYSFDGDPTTPDTAVMSLIRGCFRSITGSIGASPDDEYRIDTPVATITVRGTFHGGSFDGQTLYTVTHEGGTTVSNAQGALDAGLGGMYDYTRTRAGSAPEGLVTVPDFRCETNDQPAVAELLGTPPAPARGNLIILPAPSAAPSAPASGRRDP